MDPKLYGDEHGDMSHNEQVFTSACETGAHPLKYQSDWDEEEEVDEGAHAEDDIE